MAKIYDQITESAKIELEKLVNNKQNAIDMMVCNFYSEGKENYSSKDVCSRFQIQYFAQNPKLKTLQESGVNGWWQNEEYEPSSVNEQILPIIETATTVDEWGKKYYSSFALKEIKQNFNLRYPLIDDYASYSAPFAEGCAKALNYREIIAQIQFKLGVKIVEDEISVKSLYKRNKLELAIVKIKNIALKIAKRTDLIKTTFKGKMVLANKVGRYKFSNTEKIVKIYDELFRVGIAKQLHGIKSKTNKKTSKEIKFASRLFADLLMARITDFGDNTINKNVEKCISLQFSNVLNRYPQSAEQMKVITALGVNVVANTCERLGLTKEQIIQKMISNGYQYPKVPNDIKEAILLAKEKDYNAYMTNIQQEIEEPKPQEEIEEQDKKQQTPKEEIKKEEIALLDAPKIAGLLPKGSKELINKQKSQQKLIKQAEAMIAAQEQETKEKISAVQSELSKEGLIVNTSERIVREYLVAQQNEENKIEAQTSAREEIELTTETVEKLEKAQQEFESQAKIVSTTDRIVREYQANNQLINEFTNEQEINDNSNKRFCNLSADRVTKRFIEKAIDKVVLNLLSEKVLSIKNYLTARRFSLVGGKEAGTKNAEIYSHVLSCYQKSNSSKMAKDDGTLHSRAKSLSEHLISVKNKMIEKILDGEPFLSKFECEKSITAVNRKVKEITTTEVNPKGFTLREFFKKYLERIPKLYEELEKIDDKTN